MRDSVCEHMLQIIPYKSKVHVMQQRRRIGGALVQFGCYTNGVKDLWCSSTVWLLSNTDTMICGTSFTDTFGTRSMCLGLREVVNILTRNIV